jgi:YD repeat-containing protein
MEESPNATSAPTRILDFTFDFSDNLRSTSDSTLNGGQPLYSFGYDAVNRTTEMTAHFLPAPAGMNRDRTLRTQFDRFGNLESQTYTDLAQTLTQTLEFDRVNRLVRSVLPSGVDTRVDYFAGDLVRQISYGTLAKLQFDFEPDGAGKALRLLKGAAAQQAFELNFTTNPDGTISRIEEELAAGPPNATYTYGFDGLGRVSQASYSGTLPIPASQSFAYDAAGNVEDPADPNAFRYDANERTTGSPGGLIYRYDPDGNVTEIELPSGQKVLSTFSARNERRSVQSQATGAAAQFDYDTFGRRIRQTVNGKTTWFLWDGQLLMGEYDGATGQRIARYEYLNGSAPVAVAYRAPSGGAESTFLTAFDNAGGPRVLADLSGNIVWRAAYSALGPAKIDPDVDSNGQSISYRFRRDGAFAEDFELFPPGTPLFATGCQTYVAGMERSANAARMVFAYDAPAGETADAPAGVDSSPHRAGPAEESRAVSDDAAEDEEGPLYVAAACGGGSGGNQATKEPPPPTPPPTTPPVTIPTSTRGPDEGSKIPRDFAALGPILFRPQDPRVAVGIIVAFILCQVFDCFGDDPDETDPPPPTEDDNDDDETTIFLRATNPGDGDFERRDGEPLDISVFKNTAVDPPITDAEVLESFTKPGTGVTRVTEAEIEAADLVVVPTFGDASLPPRLREAHQSIQPKPGSGEKLTKNQRKDQFDQNTKKLWPEGQEGRRERKEREKRGG